MIVHFYLRTSWLAAVATCAFFVGAAHAASPTVADALKLEPVQKRVSFDTPDAADVAKCTIKAEKLNGQTGWVVRDSSGVVLRMFVDTNNDNVVDRWSYYQDGVEVYRDVDANFNGKADQYRWLHTGGSRWGMDKNEDGQVDEWKEISAEEVTSEVTWALTEKNSDRFSHVLLTAAELKDLGQGEDRAKELANMIKAAPADFKKLAASQKVLGAKTNWLHFGGSRPGIVPAGSDGASKDILVYENVVAMVESDGKSIQLQIGTLVRVGQVWRVIAAPQLVEDGQPEVAGGGFFFKSASPTRPDAPAGKTQDLLAELEKIDKSAGAAQTPEAIARFNGQRADLLEQLAAETKEPEGREQWQRQLADTLVAAVQMGGYPLGVERLKKSWTQLEKEQKGSEIASYFRFRYVSAEYNQAMTDPKADFPRVQTQWRDNLEQFIKEYPNSTEAPDAMLQLAIAQEVQGQDEDALKWYTKIVAQFPKSSPSQKAAGAQRRLECVGKQLEFSGASLSGGTVDLKSHKGKVVLIHFWASNSPVCVQDLETLKKLLATFGGKGFAMVGVGLDGDAKEFKEFVTKNRVTWPQIYEVGSLDSRPAVSLGILTFPTMILVDKDGKVISRNIHVSEVESELKRRIK